MTLLYSYMDDRSIHRFPGTVFDDSVAFLKITFIHLSLKTEAVGEHFSSYPVGTLQYVMVRCVVQTFPTNNHDETCGQNEAVTFVAARFSDFSVCSHSQVLWALNTSNFLVNFDILLIYADKTCKESAKPM